MRIIFLPYLDYTSINIYNHSPNLALSLVTFHHHTHILSYKCSPSASVQGTASCFSCLNKHFLFYAYCHLSKRTATLSTVKEFDCDLQWKVNYAELDIIREISSKMCGPAHQAENQTTEEELALNADQKPSQQTSLTINRLFLLGKYSSDSIWHICPKA